MKTGMATMVGLMLGAAGLTACDSASGLGGALVIITDGWQEVGGDRNFILQQVIGTQDGGREGSFEGEEIFFGDLVEGTWGDGRVNMTVLSNPEVRWEARVHRDFPDTLRFGRIGGADSLVLFASSRAN